jgi:transposase
LWRIVEHSVWRAVEKRDLSRVRRIAADETSARRGHDYISLFVDMARRKVVYVADRKDAATVKEFADFLEAHGGRREAVTDASIDMGAAFEAGIKETFPTPRSRSTNVTSSNSPTTRCGARRRGTTSRSRAGAPSS